MLFLTTTISLSFLSGLFWIMWEWVYRYNIELPIYRKGNWLVVALYAVLLYVFTKLYGGYRIGFYRVSEIIYSQIVALVFVNSITYLQISLLDRGFSNLLPMLVTSVVQVCGAFLWAFLSNRLYYNTFPPRRMVLIHNGGYTLNILEKMNGRYEKFNIVHTVLYHNNVRACCRVVTGFEAVVLSGLPVEARDEIIRYCYKNNLRTYVIPTVSDILLSNSDQIHLFDTPLMLLRNRGLSDENRFTKRILDVVLASTALVVTLPIMLLVAGFIKLYDGGPVMFLQERLTRDGKVFRVYKFRSMVIDAEKDGVARLASKDDVRITPVGAIIRKLRLDELPQLLNILQGDMSVVGPRPERPGIAAEYERIMPEFAYRLKVKAGLTGYAQILGKYNTTPQDKLLLDLMYIESYSFLLDLKLILMTVKILFWPESTEGVKQGSVLPIELGDNNDEEAAIVSAK